VKFLIAGASAFYPFCADVHHATGMRQKLYECTFTTWKVCVCVWRKRERENHFSHYKKGRKKV